MRDANLAPDSFLLPQGSSGVSEDARVIEREVISAKGLFEDVVAYEAPRWEAAQEIRRLFAECSSDNWDGHGATAIDPRSYQHAVSFLLRLPPRTVMAEATAEPDGEVAFEWHRSPERFLIVSLGRSRELTYTWRVGHERGWGVRRFDEEIPPEILECLGRVTR